MNYTTGTYHYGKFTAAQLAALTSDDGAYAADIIRASWPTVNARGRNYPATNEYFTNAGVDITVGDRVYKGDGVLLEVPSIEHENDFNKKMLNVNFSALTPFTIQRIKDGTYLAGEIMIAKCIFDINLQPVNQPVLLYRANIMGGSYYNDGKTAVASFSISHPFNDFDQTRYYRTSRDGMSEYLARYNVVAGTNYTLHASFGQNIDNTSAIRWGQK